MYLYAWSRSIESKGETEKCLYLMRLVYWHYDGKRFLSFFSPRGASYPNYHLVNPIVPERCHLCRARRGHVK